LGGMDGGLGGGGAGAGEELGEGSSIGKFIPLPPREGEELAFPGDGDEGAGRGAMGS